ncbi:MAG: response regulator [Bacteroidetes bacterium]|nr:response regulator [Bacteroidota bacterium]
MRKPDIVELKKANEIEFLGTICEVWLGVPLMASNRIIGALIVQSYSDEKAYSEKDLDVLTFVSTQIGLSVERKISENSIKENEEKLRAFFKSGIAGTCFCSIKGEIKDANREFQRILGYSGDEIVGETIDWKKQTPKEFHVIDEQKMLEAKLKGSCTPYEKQLISRDGKLIWVLIGFVLIGESKDQMILFMLDLTQRKNFELKLKESRRKAEESDILKTAFLANMSHEIRTPMNAIVGFTSFLGDPFYSNNEKAEFVGVIQKNVNALLDLIDDIIDISKIESGELRIKKVEFSLKTILDEMNKTFNNLIKSSENCKAKLEIIYTEGIEKIILYNDPNRLRQVFTNLISNAIKFTEKGKIILGYELQDHNIQFYVSDTGIGMSPEDLNIIFDRFSQAKNSLTREHGGTGLGLTISKNLVNFMGGDLWVESKLGIGSKFIFNLPFNKEEKNINEHKEGEIIEIDEAPDWSDHKILVAEDIESNFRILEQILKSTHASIIWVKKGNEAVRICKQDMEIDAVLMDVQMPGMNGYEATSLIKKFRKDLPVVAITAFAMSNEREKSRQAGCDEYIPKPIRKQRLFAILHAFLKEN